MSNTISPAYARLVELLIGSKISLALRVAAQRRIADLLANAPKSAEELSVETGLPSGSLRRLLRGLAGLGVFQESADGKYSNTEVSSYMCEGSSPSLREAILVLNDDAVLKGWLQLPEVLQSGAPAFAQVNGMSFFQYVGSDPQRSALMGKFMTGIYAPEGAKIAAGFPFGRFKSVLDVGGAQGHVLVDIMQRHPGVKGAIFELPKTAAVARQFLAAKGFAECQVYEGDFLVSVPSGFDAYFLKSVLHDWDDEKCVQILRNCKAALPENGRVLISEIVVEPGKPVGHPHRLIDLEMMVTFGGKERTAEEFEQLLQQAGLKLEQVVLIEDSFFGVVEGSRG